MTKWFLKFASIEKENDVFDAVKSGKKTIETRPRNNNSPRDYSKIKVGDILVMQSSVTGESIEKTVNFVHVYDSIEELAKNESVDKVLPGINTADELIKAFEKLKKRWGNRYKEKLEKYGIVAIGI